MKKKLYDEKQKTNSKKVLRTFFETKKKENFLLFF
jgi:hypothetical protein